MRYKPALLDKVWFKHPGTGTWIEVLNKDPLTGSMSHYQLTLTRRMQKAGRSDGTIIGVAEAMNHIRKVGSTLLSSKNKRERKRGMQLLGILPAMSASDEAQPALETRATPSISDQESRRRRTGRKRRATSDQTSVVDVSPRDIVQKALAAPNKPAVEAVTSVSDTRYTQPAPRIIEVPIFQVIGPKGGSPHV